MLHKTTARPATPYVTLLGAPDKVTNCLKKYDGICRRFEFEELESGKLVARGYRK